MNKRQGKLLLKELNAPKHLYLKEPTADLEEARPALADEVALGVTYDAIDDYLEGKEVSEHDAKIIENWYQKKRNINATCQLAFSIAFGTRIDNLIVNTCQNNSFNAIILMT